MTVVICRGTDDGQREFWYASTHQVGRSYSRVLTLEGMLANPTIYSANI